MEGQGRPGQSKQSRATDFQIGRQVDGHDDPDFTVQLPRLDDLKQSTINRSDGPCTQDYHH